MKYVLSLRDSKAEMFHNPFCVPTLAVAYRDLQATVMRGGEENHLAQFKDDFEVWQLGTFDEDTGVLDVGPGPFKLCSVGALVAEPASPVAAAVAGLAEQMDMRSRN